MKSSILYVSSLIAVALCANEPVLSQWTPTAGPGHGRNIGYVSSFAVFGSKLYAGASRNWVFVTSDTGRSWTVDSTGMTDLNVDALLVSGGKLIAGVGSGGGIFLSTDGSTWTPAMVSSSDNAVMCLAASGTKLFAGTMKGKILCSLDSGSHWNDCATIAPSAQIYALTSTAGIMFAGTLGNGVYRSSDDGASWKSISEDVIQSVLALAVIDGTIIAGTGAGIFLSTDNGGSWTQSNSGLGKYVGTRSLALNGIHIYAGTGSGVFYSNNRGATWTGINEGLTNPVVESLGITGSFLFCGDDSGLVWKRPLAEITSVSSANENTVKEFTIGQNYPNPVHNATTIEFSVPQAGFMSLKVYNVFGGLVRTLAEEILQPGNYVRVWNAAGLPGGMYFYRLEAGGIIETRKMTVIK